MEILADAETAAYLWREIAIEISAVTAVRL
jgi:hypothetical protein